MPRHRRHHGMPRLLVPATLAAIAFAAVGSLVAGTMFGPASAGQVGAVEGVVSEPLVGGYGAAPGPLTIEAPGSGTTDALDAGGDRVTARRHVVVDRGPIPPAALTGYQWPLPHGRITLPFGPSKWGSRLVNGEAFHDGLDLATFCGDRIVAAHGGVVLAASRHYDVQMGWIGDLTPYLDRLDAKGLWLTLPIVVVIDDGNGYRSIYAHLSKAEVKKGQTVAAGEFIGYEGKTGRASGCHLHYGLFSPEEPAQFGIDPGVVERMKLPARQIARIDPLLVLPERQTAPPPAVEPPALAGPGSKPPLE